MRTRLVLGGLVPDRLPQSRLVRLKSLMRRDRLVVGSVLQDLRRLDMTERLGLAIAGVDYVLAGHDAMLLEVNAYPGLEDLPDSGEAFVEMAAAWWAGLVKGRL